MAGLDNVTPATDTSDESVSLGGKGAKAVVANESVLANMERLYQQKQAQNQGFLGSIMEGLKDAAAWTSGGMQGPAEALALRATEKDKQAKELFDMQTQIAAQKAAIANRNAFFGQPAQGTQAAGQPAQGTQAEGQPGAVNGPGIAQANQASGGLLGLVRDPALRQAIGATYLQDPTKAMTALNAHLAKMAEPSDVQKRVDYLRSIGYSEDMAKRAALIDVIGSGALVPHDVRGSGGTGQQTPFDTTGKYTGAPAATQPLTGAPVATPVAPPANTGTYPISRGPSAQHPNATDVASPVGTPVTTTTGGTIRYHQTDPAGYGNAADIIDDNGKIIGRVAHLDQYAVPNGTKVQPGTVIGMTGGSKGAPGAGNSTGPHAHIEGTGFQVGSTKNAPPASTGFAPGSKEDLEIRAAAAKKLAESTIESQTTLDTEAQKKEEENAQKRLDALTSSAQGHVDTENKLNTFENLIKETPTAIGFDAMPGLKGTILDVAENQKILPFGKETVIKNMIGDRAYENRKQLLSLAADLALKYRKDVYKGTGAVSDAESKYAEKAKGLGDENSPKVNIEYARLMSSRSTLDKQLYDGWDQYQKDLKAQGKVAKYRDFEKSQFAKDAYKAHDDRLKSLHPEWYKEESKGGQRKTKSGVTYEIH